MLNVDKQLSLGIPPLCSAKKKSILLSTKVEFICMSGYHAFRQLPLMKILKRISENDMNNSNLEKVLISILSIEKNILEQ